MLLAQTVPASVHYHHAWVIWTLFFVGTALHIFMQVSDIAQKNKLTRKNVLLAIAPALSFRSFFTAMTFGLLWHYPLIISGALKMFGINVGSSETEALSIPMNNFIAGLYGLLLDSIFGYVPGLKSWLPDIMNPLPISQAQPTVKL